MGCKGGVRLAGDEVGKSRRVRGGNGEGRRMIRLGQLDGAVRPRRRRLPLSICFHTIGTRACTRERPAWGCSSGSLGNCCERGNAVGGNSKKRSQGMGGGGRLIVVS